MLRHAVPKTRISMPASWPPIVSLEEDRRHDEAGAAQRIDPAPADTADQQRNGEAAGETGDGDGEEGEADVARRAEQHIGLQRDARRQRGARHRFEREHHGEGVRPRRDEILQRNRLKFLTRQCQCASPPPDYRRKPMLSELYAQNRPARRAASAGVLCGAGGYFGLTPGLPPGEPGGGTTGMLRGPGSGVGASILRSTLSGGLMTPPERESY